MSVMDVDKIKVLMVDDDEDDYIIIRDYLSEIREVKYDMTWTDEYASALEHIRENSYDVFLFDYRLGKHNGLELLQELAGSGCKTPAILLTGQDDHDIDMQAMKSGAYDYLVKNQIGPSVLERSIRYAMEHKKMEDELFQEKERAIVTLESIGDSVITTDVNGVITHLNVVAEKVTGWKNDEVRELYFFDAVRFVNELTREIVDDPIAKVMQQKKIIKFPGQTILINREGREYAIEGTVSPIHNRGNDIIGTVIIIHDVTDNRELSKRLYYQASHDSLTGLANRFNFEERLRQLVDDARYLNQEHALFYLDLDQFKIINDTCGHFAGDQLLKQIASLMKETVRQNDVIARLGGDEFGILLKDTPVYKACDVATKICKIIKEFHFNWKDKLFTIGVSIGVVAVNARYSDFERILIAADQSCYIAKEKGGNRFHLYQDDDQELSERHDEMQLMLKLTKAFEEDQFCLHCQPIVPLSTGGQQEWYEILIRMLNKGGRMILPNAFLPTAQRYNMMLAVDRWVISTFFNYYEQNRMGDRGKNPIRFNINISGSSLNNEHFLEFVYEQLNEHHVIPQTICFEITETTAIANFNKAVQFIQKLKSLGCKFALDDFGSGLSSFNYLKHLPVDFVKIDGIFVKNIIENSVDSAMVTAINEIAHLMGIETVAEFVENQSILEKLKEMGVDYAQGTWVGDPMPLDRIPV